jgi:hypothetical protein
VYEVGPEIHLTIADFDMAMLENPNDAPIDPRGAPGRALPVGFIRRSKPDTVTSVATTPTTLKKTKKKYCKANITKVVVNIKNKNKASKKATRRKLVVELNISH